MSQYKELFISESREHLHSMNELIVLLEKEADDREKIDSLFRVAHSIKGMAASMGYSDIADLAHKIEDLMDKVRK
ncbi:MAG TPA: Hpt domain-containing protein, partial [Geobacteraceae bacterium]|nr:Hpt domain-containing protein [Geobacteraceae bacterium]